MTAQISLCITTMNRFDAFLSKYLKHYVSFLADNIIDEIVICDETGGDYDKIIEAYGDVINAGKFKVYKNDTILGVFKNKIKVCRLATHQYIALIDSDNFPDRDYFINAKTFINTNKLGDNVLICPSFSRPRDSLNYKRFCGHTITKQNLHTFIKDGLFSVVLNTGNYVVSSNIFKNFTYTESFMHGDEIVTLDKIASCDVIYFHLRVFQQFPDFELYVIDNMEYDHVVHPDSEYLKKHHIGDNFLTNYIMPELFKLF